ncbi:conserved protein of unknown function [Methanocaldococcus lauensis]|nr:conserved protein of unknown function [Methanocaldococcus lauensis]
MKLKYFFILIFGLIYLLSPINCIQIDKPQYEPLKIHPGDDVDLWIKITNNNYNNEVKNIIVKISPHYPFELRQIHPTIGKAEISHLNPGESDIVYFKLHVNENAPSDNYRIDITVNYDEIYNKGSDDERLIHYNITKVYYLPVYGIAKFQIIIDNNSISPSKSKTIIIRLINEGTGNAKYVSINFFGNNKINVLGSGNYYIGFLKAKCERDIPITIYAVPEIENGIYTIYANINWIGDEGNFYNFSTPINIKVVKKIYKNQPFIYLDDVDFKDDIYEVTIGVANRGMSKMRHCVLTLNVNGKNYTKYVGDLDEDDYDTLVYTLYDVNGTVPLNVFLNYFDDYQNEYTVSKTFIVNFEHKEVKENNYWIIGILIIFGILLIIYYLRKRRKRESFEEL